LEKARELGADQVATGHYAVIDQAPGGRWRLSESANRAKDQSYVLYCLTQEALARTLLPLGGIADKAETRRIAAELGMAVSTKPDSQDICFVGPDGYAAVLGDLAPEALEPGEIVDRFGTILGIHDGIGRYTVGQRRRLPASSTGPLYVTAIDAPTRRVIVGTADQVFADRCIVGAINWVSVVEPAKPLAVSVRIRYNATVQAARISAPRSDGRVECRFDEPQRAVTPGQSAVFYHDGVVLGGGVIQSVRAEERGDVIDRA
ncbi:MAG: tRNA 2-thiouridine(34) synthase MnmA, partial [Armatimonadetes bacterium]|nr:tRNA 2-thiouridine(34) synthase MnmA [Armatimonadota bacterium]